MYCVAWSATLGDEMAVTEKTGAQGQVNQERRKSLGRKVGIELLRWSVVVMFAVGFLAFFLYEVLDAVDLITGLISGFTVSGVVLAFLAWSSIADYFKTETPTKSPPARKRQSGGAAR
jgi:hypothetical protein